MKHHRGFEDDSLETGGLTTIELPTSCTSHVTVFEDCLVPFLRSARLNLEALGIGRSLSVKISFVLEGVCGQLERIQHVLQAFLLKHVFELVSTQVRK